EGLGNVVPPVEGDERFPREPLDDLPGADHRSTVGVAVEEELVEPKGEVATRVVLAEPHLLEDDALLEVERLLAERRVHAYVAEHLDGSDRARRGKQGVVVRVVERRPRVDPPPESFDLGGRINAGTSLDYTN